MRVAKHQRAYGIKTKLWLYFALSLVILIFTEIALNTTSSYARHGKRNLSNKSSHTALDTAVRNHVERLTERYIRNERTVDSSAELYHIIQEQVVVRNSLREKRLDRSLNSARLDMLRKTNQKFVTSKGATSEIYSELSEVVVQAQKSAGVPTNLDLLLSFSGFSSSKMRYHAMFLLSHLPGRLLERIPQSVTAAHFLDDQTRKYGVATIAGGWAKHGKLMTLPREKFALEEFFKAHSGQTLIIIGHNEGGKLVMRDASDNVIDQIEIRHINGLAERYSVFPLILACETVSQTKNFGIEGRIYPSQAADFLRMFPTNGATFADVAALYSTFGRFNLNIAMLLDKYSYQVRVFNSATGEQLADFYIPTRGMRADYGEVKFDDDWHLSLDAEYPLSQFSRFVKVFGILFCILPYVLGRVVVRWIATTGENTEFGYGPKLDELVKGIRVELEMLDRIKFFSGLAFFLFAFLLFSAEYDADFYFAAMLVFLLSVCWITFAVRHWSRLRQYRSAVSN